MSVNKLTQLPELRQPQLFKLNLNENLIATANNFSGHPNLRILELKKNKLTDCGGICNMENLEELYLSENEIKDVSQLKNMPKLKKLDLNTNKIESLKNTNLDLPSLEHFDIGANAIASAETIQTLAKFPKLKNFIAAGNPFADELGDKLKGEILFQLYPAIKIKFIGEDEITEDDLAAWKAERRERLKAQEEARRQAELAKD